MHSSLLSIRTSHKTSTFTPSTTAEHIYPRFVACEHFVTATTELERRGHHGASQAAKRLTQYSTRGMTAITRKQILSLLILSSLLKVVKDWRLPLRGNKLHTQNTYKSRTLCADRTLFTSPRPEYVLYTQNTRVCDGLLVCNSHAKHGTRNHEVDGLKYFFRRSRKHNTLPPLRLILSAIARTDEAWEGTPACCLQRLSSWVLDNSSKNHKNEQNRLFLTRL